MSHRYPALDLIQYATAILEKAGVETRIAQVVAEILVEGDLMGHNTHGLQLLGKYLEEIEAGDMAKSGEPEIVSERPAILLWDGKTLPGPWLVVKALEEASARAKTFGTATVIIRHSQHIACLAAYLRPVAEQGLVAMLMSSDPSVGGVAPHGGTSPLYTPNPVAACYPTKGDPVIMDVSMSTTTMGLSGRNYAEGQKMPHQWLKSAKGEITDDPSVLFTDPPGSILPLGGEDSGHKGYALGLLVEALTSSMGGFGRSDKPTGWGASVYIHVIDPEAFGGLDAFTRDTQWMAEACRGSDVADGDPKVRVPGERGLMLRRENLENGVDLHPGILDSLIPWAEKLGIEPLV